MNTSVPAYQKWIEILKEKGYTADDIAKMLAGVVKSSSMELFTLIMATLSEDDIKQVEAVEDDEKAKQKILEIFQQKAGMTAEELFVAIRDGLITQSLT